MTIARTNFGLLDDSAGAAKSAAAATMMATTNDRKIRFTRCMAGFFQPSTAVRARRLRFRERVPFFRAHPPEKLLRRDVRHRHRMPLGSLQFTEHLVAHANHGV